MKTINMHDIDSIKEYFFINIHICPTLGEQYTFAEITKEILWLHSMLRVEVKIYRTFLFISQHISSLWIIKENGYEKSHEVFKILNF